MVGLVPEPSPAGAFSCVSASARVRPAAAPGPASELLDVHLTKAASGVLRSPQGAPSTTSEPSTRASTLGHHPRGITTRMLHHWGITPRAAPLGHHHGDSTTEASPPGLHHRLLALDVPEAFTGARADPLWLPSSWLGRRRGLPTGYRGSPACNRAWCDLGSLCWAAPKLLPRVLAQATRVVSRVTPPSSSSQAPHLRMSKRWTNLIILDLVFGFSWHPENPLLYWVICTCCNLCSSEDTRDFSLVHVNMFSIVAFGGATSPFCPCFLIRNICFLFRTFIFY